MLHRLLQLRLRKRRCPSYLFRRLVFHLRTSGERTRGLSSILLYRYRLLHLPRLLMPMRWQRRQPLLQPRPLAKCTSSGDQTDCGTRSTPQDGSAPFQRPRMLTHPLSHQSLLCLLVSKGPSNGHLQSKRNLQKRQSRELRPHRNSIRGQIRRPEPDAQFLHQGHLPPRRQDLMILARWRKLLLSTWSS